MTTVANKIDLSQAVQEIGVLRRVSADTLHVETDAGTVACRRAVSCLVAPAAGDTVLIATATTGRAWVLAVLEREASDAATRLEVEGDLDLHLKDGKFTVAAQEGVSLVSGKEVNVVSGRFNLNAVDGNVALQRLTYVGKFVRSEVEKIKSLASTFDSVLDRFSQRVKRSYRTVEELEQLKARQLDYKVDKTLAMRSGNALVTAENLVKVDGDQIHLG